MDRFGLGSLSFSGVQSILMEMISNSKTAISSSDPIAATQPSTSRPLHHGWFYRRVALPILALLRMGASPRRLAWSIAIGLLVGINPLLGSTTLLCMAVAFAFRLNLAASQLANHAMYPLQLVLIVPFLQVAARLFGTGPLPFSAKTLYADARARPVHLMRQLWTWEWHALIVWGALAVILVPLVATLLQPVLQRLLRRVERHQYPLIGAEKPVD
jgi:uncharacterized protein (DUF2062 family)